MKKSLFFFLLIAAASISSAFSVKEWRDTIYNQIKSETIKEIKKSFGKDIKIGSVEGIIAGQFLFKDVELPGIARAQKIYLYFNPATYLSKKDMVSAISKITIENGEFSIARSKNNRWNYEDFSGGEGGGEPPPFLALVELKNCKANYLDEFGFTQKVSYFLQKAENLNGKVDLRNKGKILINLAGDLLSNEDPTPIKFSASFDLKKKYYNLDVLAANADVEKWGNYAIPVPPLKFKGGRADAVLNIKPPKTPGWPIAFTGNFNLKNASAQFMDYQIENTQGNLLMQDEQLAFRNVSTEINGIELKVEGKYFNFKKHNLSLNLLFEKTNLKKAADFFLPVKNLVLEGNGNARLKVSGTISSPEARGTINIEEAKFYQQDFSGESDLYYLNRQLTFNIPVLRLYKGQAKGILEIQFLEDKTLLSFSSTYKDIDLAALSQNAPGVEGKASGQLELVGPINDLKGDISASLTQALLLGQPVEIFVSSFRIKEANIFLESFKASSPAASISSSGKISSDLNFDFMAEASGIKLAGKGIFGPQEALVDHFRGSLNFKLDENFFISPLKNLSAQGEVRLSQGEIGEQHFDLAQGKLSIGKGRISIDDVVFRQNESSLEVSGQTGIGYATDLNIFGKNVNLKDLKLVNYLLPDEFKNPEGFADININFTGEISKDAQIVSFDPLLDLNASGKFILEKADVGGIPIDYGNFNLDWKDHDLIFSDCSIFLPDSSLDFDLKYQRNNFFAGKVSGVLDFYNLRNFTNKYAMVEGKLGLNTVFEGNLQNPSIAASFWLDNPRFNRLNFDRIEGSLVYFENKLSSSGPLIFLKDKDRFTLFGIANLEGLLKNQPEETHLNLELKTDQADLSNSYTIFTNIRREFFSRFTPPTPGYKSKIDYSRFMLPNINSYLRNGKLIFYSANGEKQFFLKSFNQLIPSPEAEFEDEIAPLLGGKLSGKLNVSGKVKKLSANLHSEIEDGRFINFGFDIFTISSQLENQKIIIENALLKKKNGKLSARGEIDLGGGLNFNVSAARFPMDILNIYFDKEFNGEFNLSSTIYGSINNPSLSLEMSGGPLNLAGVNYDKVSIAAEKKENLIKIEDFSIENKKQISNISGEINLKYPILVSLEADLKDDALGLVNLFTEDVKWIQGKGFARANIYGTEENLNIGGDIKLDDSLVFVRILESPLSNLQGEAKIENGLLKIIGLYGTWRGDRTRGYANPLALAGNIDLNKFLAKDRMVYLNLSFSPTQLYADFPSLYTGAINVDEAALTGPLYFDLSRGPTLSGKIKLNNSLITLNPNRKSKEPVFPLNFDLKLNLDRNVYVVMGDITTIDLSSIFMDLEIRSEELKVTGNLAYPSLLGKVALRRGTVTIFNREFSLLSKDQQEKYYPARPEKVSENTAEFFGEKGKAGTLPYVNLTAQVDVEEQEKDAAGNIVKKKVYILSHLTGVPGEAEKDRRLNITFDSFVEDVNGGIYNIRPGGYSEQEIKVMLLPDFIKALAGVSKEEGEEVKADTNVVIADYLSSRVQTFVFRGLERELEQRLALESLTLEYNFGKDIRQAMGVKEERTIEGDRPDWRVGFVKGFFDKFYVDVRYAQTAIETGAQLSSLNYQLTYKLSPIWSIIYYREPISVQELASGFQKVTLRAGFSFW